MNRTMRGLRRLGYDLALLTPATLESLGILLLFIVLAILCGV